VFFTAHGLKVRIPLRYAAIHQWGGKAGRGLAVTIPARPYLPSERPPDLPPDWEQALHLSVRVVLSRHLG
jgi:phage gpG-like protein